MARPIVNAPIPLFQPVPPVRNNAPMPQIQNMGYIGPPPTAVPAQPPSVPFSDPYAAAPMPKPMQPGPSPAARPAPAPAMGGLLGDITGNQLTHGLLGLGSQLMAAGAPSFDPRSQSLGYALSQGIGGMQQGMQYGRQLDEFDYQKRQREKKEQAGARIKERLSPVLADIYDVDPQTALSVAFRPDEYDIKVVDGAAVVMNKATGELVKQHKLPQTGKTYERTEKMRKELRSSAPVKNFEQSLNLYESAVKAAKRDDRISDVDLVFAVAKIYDPNSVVREGEVITVQNADQLPRFLTDIISRASGGGRIGPDVREQLLRSARDRMTVYETQIRGINDFYRGIAEKNNLPADQIIMPIPSFSALPSLMGSGNGGSSGNEVIY